jgi:hypothetical protein
MRIKSRFDSVDNQPSTGRAPMAEAEIVWAAPVPVFVADYTPIIEITISARTGRDHGSLTVMDNGPGVPPQHRDKIVSASGCGRTSQPHRQGQLPEW